MPCRGMSRVGTSEVGPRLAMTGAGGHVCGSEQTHEVIWLASGLEKNMAMTEPPVGQQVEVPLAPQPVKSPRQQLWPTPATVGPAAGPSRVLTDPAAGSTVKVEPAHVCTEVHEMLIVVGLIATASRASLALLTQQAGSHIKAIGMV